MKTITVRVTEVTYRELRDLAREHGRTMAELVRQALKDYRAHAPSRQTTLRDLRPSSVGAVLKPFPDSDDPLGEMIDDERH